MKIEGKDIEFLIERTIIKPSTKSRVLDMNAKIKVDGEIISLKDFLGGLTSVTIFLEKETPNDKQV